MNKHVLVEDIETFSGNLFCEENLQDFFALIVSCYSNSSVRFDFSHLIEHHGHLLNLLNTELGSDFGVENLVSTFKRFLDSLLLSTEAVEMNEVHEELVLICLFEDVLGSLYLKERLILCVDAVDFLLRQLLQMKQLHEDLKKQQVMPLIDSVRGRRGEVVLFNDALEHMDLLELLL